MESERQDERTRPEKRRYTISATALKWIGLVLTCLSSVGVAVIQRGLLKIDAYTTMEDFAAAMEDPASGMMSLGAMAVACSLLATMAAPLYAKVVYEGWKRSRDRRRLMLSLLLCALASEIPYDFAMSGSPLGWSIQNPVWGLLLGVVMLEAMSRLKVKFQNPVVSALAQGLVVIGALALTVLLGPYMGTTLVLLAALFRFLEGNWTMASLGAALLTANQFPAPLGMLLAHWYEPDEEERHPVLFYVLYPAQLLVFGAAGMLLK